MAVDVPPRKLSTAPASDDARDAARDAARAAAVPPSAAAQRAALRLGASRLRLAIALAGLRAESDDGDGDNAADARAGAAPDGTAGRPFGTRLIDDLFDAIGLRGHAPLAWLAWRVGRTLGRDRLASWSTRHPWRLVGAVALGGALLVSARPWRLLTRPAVVVGLLMQLASAARAPRPADPASADAPRTGRWRRTTGPRPGVFR